MLIRAYEKYSESSSIAQRMALQLDHVERSAAMIEQIRSDRHELKNIFFYLNSLSEAGKYDEIREFCEDHLTHRYDRLEEFNTGNEILDYLLTQKVSEAREANIHVMADVLLPPALPIVDIDLCSLLMNLLDNAIDASKKEERGDIQILMNIKKNYLSLTVRNKSSQDILKNNPSLRTSKDDFANHGIGTRVIRSICKKYNGMVDYRMENGYFVADVMLELPE